MAILHATANNLTSNDTDSITQTLASIGIVFKKLNLDVPEFAVDSDDHTILEYFSNEIEHLKSDGGYTLADVVTLKQTTLNLEELLEKFSRKHWHDEDEVRLILGGRGIFYFVPEMDNIVSIEMEKGELIRIPKGTEHWFELCEDKNIRAIRLFQNPSGWIPYYTQSNIEAAS